MWSKLIDKYCTVDINILIGIDIVLIIMLCYVIKGL